MIGKFNLQVFPNEQSYHTRTLSTYAYLKKMAMRALDLEEIFLQTINS